MRTGRFEKTMNEQSQLPDPGSDHRDHALVVSEAIGGMLHALERRAKLYRNLIVSITALLTLSILLAIALGSWTPLLGFLFVIPLVAIFLLLDNREVRHWQECTINLWCFHRLNLKEFESRIVSYRHIPEQFRNQMLSTLPRDSAESPVDQFSDEERAALLRWHAALVHYEAHQTTLEVMAVLLAFSFLIATLVYWSGVLLLCLAGSILLWVASQII